MNGRRFARFACLFALWLGGLYAVLQIPFVQAFVRDPYSAAQVASTAAVLRILGVAASVDGLVLRAPGFDMRITNELLGGCNGLNVVVILIAAVAAYPAPIRHRLVGIAVGAAVLFIVNVVRLVSLYFVGAHAPGLEEMMHLYVWQVLLIAVTGFIWFQWAERVPGPE
ncbi:MAG: exosortase H [Planctomycetes bacterium]|nr:exosortase H [Planctomycetota bacterium]